MKKDRMGNAEDLLDSAVDLDQLILVEAELLLQGPSSANAELRKSLHRIAHRAIESADLLRNIQDRIRPPARTSRFLVERN